MAVAGEERGVAGLFDRRDLDLDFPVPGDRRAQLERRLCLDIAIGDQDRIGRLQHQVARHCRQLQVREADDPADADLDGGQGLDRDAAMLDLGAIDRNGRHPGLDGARVHDPLVGDIEADLSPGARAEEDIDGLAAVLARLADDPVRERAVRAEDRVHPAGRRHAQSQAAGFAMGDVPGHGRAPVQHAFFGVDGVIEAGVGAEGRA